MKEALKRDPGESRVNTWMGNLLHEKGHVCKSGRLFSHSCCTDNARLHQAANCEALFGLGLALKNLGRFEDASDTLYRATWDYAWHSAAYYQLACISVILHDLDKAYELVEQSLGNNMFNYQALALNASILRNLGQPDKALEILDAALRRDPLDWRMGYERFLCLIAFAADCGCGKGGKYAGEENEGS